LYLLKKFPQSYAPKGTILAQPSEGFDLLVTEMQCCFAPLHQAVANCLDCKTRISEFGYLAHQFILGRSNNEHVKGSISLAIESTITTDQKWLVEIAISAVKL